MSALWRKLVTAVWNGKLSAFCPEKMTKNNDTIALSMKSFKESFKVIDWVKSRKKKTIKKYPVLN